MRSYQSCYAFDTTAWYRSYYTIVHSWFNMVYIPKTRYLRKLSPFYLHDNFQKGDLRSACWMLKYLFVIRQRKLKLNMGCRGAKWKNHNVSSGRSETYFIFDELKLSGTNLPRIVWIMWSMNCGVWRLTHSLCGGGNASVSADIWMRRLQLPALWANYAGGNFSKQELLSCSTHSALQWRWKPVRERWLASSASLKQCFSWEGQLQLLQNLFHSFTDLQSTEPNQRSLTVNTDLINNLPPSWWKLSDSRWNCFQ